MPTPEGARKLDMQLDLTVCHADREKSNAKSNQFFKNSLTFWTLISTEQIKALLAELAFRSSIHINGNWPKYQWKTSSPGNEKKFRSHTQSVSGKEDDSARFAPARTSNKPNFLKYRQSLHYCKSFCTNQGKDSTKCPISRQMSVFPNVVECSSCLHKKIW